MLKLLHSLAIIINLIIVVYSILEDKKIVEEEKKQLKEELKKVIAGILREFKVNEAIIAIIISDNVINLLTDFLLGILRKTIKDLI